MKNKTHIKKLFSGIVATILGITAFSILGLNFPSNSKVNADSLRTYIRHDCNTNTNYEYDLNVSFDNNLPISPMTIIPPNDMVRDYDESVVRIEGIEGSGFIVGDHLILTAAHCVYSNGFLHNNISIVNSNNVVVDTISPRYIHINKNYTTNGPYSIDYALIYVEEDLSDYGSFNLGLALDSYILRCNTVTASGFPQTYPPGYQGVAWGLRFKSVGNIIGSQSTTSLIYHDADTYTGDSGGPLYIEEGITINNSIVEYKTVVGITVAQDFQNEYNISVRITPDILKFVYDNPNHTP